MGLWANIKGTDAACSVGYKPDPRNLQDVTPVPGGELEEAHPGYWRGATWYQLCSYMYRNMKNLNPFSPYSSHH